MNDTFNSIVSFSFLWFSSHDKKRAYIWDNWIRRIMVDSSSLVGGCYSHQLVWALIGTLGSMVMFFQAMDLVYWYVLPRDMFETSSKTP